MRYGDSLRRILQRQDTEIRRLGGRGDIADSMDALDLTRQLNELGEQTELMAKWNKTGSGGIDPNVIKLPFYPISSYVLEKDTAELVIDIPSAYKHLLIMGQGRVNGSGGQAAVMTLLQFNGDTGANYVWGVINQANTTLTGGQDLAATSTPLIYMVADGFAAGPAGNAFLFIPHYNSAYYKNILTIASVYGTNTNTVVRQGNWKSTSPVQSMRLFTDPAYPSAKIESGSLISVYGIL